MNNKEGGSKNTGGGYTAAGIKEGGSLMKRDINIKGINFYIANYTPRKNEFEKGLKYRLFVDNTPTGCTFETLHAARDYIKKNYFLYL